MSDTKRLSAVLTVLVFLSALMTGCAAQHGDRKAVATHSPKATAHGTPAPAHTASLADQCTHLKAAMLTAEQRLQTVGDDLKSGKFSAADKLDDITGSLDTTVSSLKDAQLKASAVKFNTDVHDIAQTLDDAVDKAKHLDINGALADQKKAMALKDQAATDAQALHTICAD